MKYKKVFNHIWDCVCCGFCCSQAPCGYGEWNSKKKQCIFLTESNENGQRFCKKYVQIVEQEKDCKYPMFNCGCSSTLFNTTRKNVIDKLKEN